MPKAYKVKMWDVGSRRAKENRMFHHRPGYKDLREMAAKHLLSADIEFHANDMEQLPITDGRIYVGGLRRVGYFSIEEVMET